jgi:hypothetical protein
LAPSGHLGGADECRLSGSRHQSEYTECPLIAFYPIIGQMERSAGFAYDDRPPAKLDKLDAALAQTSTSGQDAALFAEMLSLPNDGRYPALELTPEQRRQREQGISRAVLGHATAARCDDVGALTQNHAVLRDRFRLNRIVFDDCEADDFVHVLPESTFEFLSRQQARHADWRNIPRPLPHAAESVDCLAA